MALHYSCSKLFCLKDANFLRSYTCGLGILVAVSLQALGQNSSLTLEQLSVEYKANPIGLDTPEPRFSWKLNSKNRNTSQKQYAIQVARDEKFSKRTLVWSSGEVVSDESHLIEYAGDELMSKQRYFWRVSVTDNFGNLTTSAPQSFEMGLRHESDWKAQWVEPEKDGFDPKKQQPASMLRREFLLKNKIVSARLYVSSRGFNEMYLNGQRVSEDILSPGWTAYQARFQYFTYDVTNLVKTGPNALGAMLGDGWYRGYLVWENNRNLYGTKVALLAQLVVKYADGSEQTIGTDNSWKANNNGPVRENDLYNGETYDARMEKIGCNTVGFDEAGWWNVKEANHPKNNLVAPVGLPTRRQEKLKPTKIFKTPAGETVVDFGQNMVGWVKFTVQGAASTKIRLTHAEVLDQKGNFYTANLRAAKCEINYTLKGGGPETYEPRFTFMGFRYVRVEGWPSELTPDQITGVVIHSEMNTSGSFECSNALLNQLQHNIVWGQKGNFVDVPTDCPQRDERLGWTGDAQAFARTATFNKDVAGFFTKWLRDVALDQKADGSVPFVVPDVIRNNTASSGWADVATIVPWEMYQVYGDRRLLQNQYESMKKWVGYIQNQAGETHLWTTGFHFGDWLSYRGTDALLPEPKTDNDFIASAFYAQSARLTAQAALVLSKPTDAAYYGELYEKIKKAFQQEYVSANGRLACNTQTAYVLALHFDLLPDHLRPQAVERLVKDIKAHGNHLTTGFLGTPYLCHVLTRFGQNDMAYTLLMQETYPSWLYPVKKGATTIWERWDGIKPDGSFQDVGMNSFNHYAYGAIGDWMYQHISGIQLGKAGFKTFTIAPKIGGGLTSAKATYECPYGTIGSAWEMSGGQTKVTVKVPANTRAYLLLPNASNDKMRTLATTQQLKFSDKGIELGSGEYSFVY